MDNQIIIPPDGVGVKLVGEWYSVGSLHNLTMLSRDPAAFASYVFDVEPGNTYYIWLTWEGGTDRPALIRISAYEWDYETDDFSLLVYARQQDYNGFPSLAHGVPDETGRRWFCAYSYTVVRSESIELIVNAVREPWRDSVPVLEAPIVQVMKSENHHE